MNSNIKKLDTLQLQYVPRGMEIFHEESDEEDSDDEKQMKN